MDRKHIDERHMVVLYLADKLTGEERAAFESQMLEHPELVQEVEQAARLKVGLMRLQERGELDALLRRKPWHRQPRFYAWAASLVLILAALLLWVDRSPTQPVLVASLSAWTDASGRPLPVAASRSLLRVRGAQYDATIETTDVPAAVELRLLPEFETQPPVYRVALSYIDESGAATERGSLPGVAAGADGYVTVYVDSGALEPGQYRLSLSPADAVASSANTSDFSILVRPRN